MYTATVIGLMVVLAGLAVFMGHGAYKQDTQIMLETKPSRH
nr:hypothetical protein [Alicyclobacillus tolerans]